MPDIITAITKISIHTPARGVTVGTGRTVQRAEWQISIHTPARGVTYIPVDRLGDQKISIHTPARGVTKEKAEAAAESENFNPHSREGSDN